MSLFEAFQQARQSGESTVSRWTLGTGSRKADLVGFEVLAKPKILWRMESISFRSTDCDMTLRISSGVKEALLDYCHQRHCARAIPLKAARKAYPGLRDADALARFLGVEEGEGESHDVT